MSKQIDSYSFNERPFEVGLALTILWSSFIFGIVASLVSLYAMLANNALSVFLPILVVFGSYGYLIAAISNGKNWARISLLVFVLIGTGYGIYSFSSYFSDSMFQNTVGIIQGLFQIIAVVALFTSNSNAWFD